MRAIALIAALSAGLIMLGACAQSEKPDSADVSSSNTGATSGAKGMYYLILMDRILNTPLGFADNNASYRVGEENPYRNIGGSKHKALAACLVWDSKTLGVSHLGWNAWVGDDWSGTEFIALRNCRSAKRQKQSNCVCQIIDHDDENVLEIPTDFLTAHKKKFSASAN